MKSKRWFSQEYQLTGNLTKGPANKAALVELVIHCTGTEIIIHGDEIKKMSIARILPRGQSDKGANKQSRFSWVGYSLYGNGDNYTRRWNQKDKSRKNTSSRATWQRGPQLINCCGPSWIIRYKDNYTHAHFSVDSDRDRFKSSKIFLLVDLTKIDFKIQRFF